jgi:hypothetical protein
LLEGWVPFEAVVPRFLGSLTRLLVGLRGVVLMDPVERRSVVQVLWELPLDLSDWTVVELVEELLSSVSRTLFEAFCQWLVVEWIRAATMRPEAILFGSLDSV